MGVSIDSTVTVANGQLTAPMPDGAVVLSMDTDTYFGLDEVAARIWEIVERPTPVRVVVDTIASEFDVEAGRCTPDVLSFLTDLEGRGLVQVTA